MVCVICSFIDLNVFVMFLYVIWGIKLGFRLGKSSLCTLLRGNFPGAKFGLYRSISVSHLWNRCDQHSYVIRTCFVYPFQLFHTNGKCHTKFTIAKGCHSTIAQ